MYECCQHCCRGWRGGGVSLSVLRHWAATDFSRTRHQVHWMFLFHSLSVNECDKLQLQLILGDSLFPGSGGRFQGISECPRFVLNFWTIVVFVPFDILPRMLARSLSVLWIGSVTVCSEFPFLSTLYSKRVWSNYTIVLVLTPVTVFTHTCH